MNRESIVFAISGAFFGLIVGWILGSQQRTDLRAGSPAANVAQATAPTGSAPGQAGAPAPLDQARVQALRAASAQNPGDAGSRVELGNMYFDAEQYQEAIKWYEEALKLNPRNVDVSTDLGVSYYYTNQPDRALKQFDYSLGINPTHAKTILNTGIVRAFGKQDLNGAAEAWQRVMAIAPDSSEGRAAKQALDSLKAAHPGLGTGKD